MAPAASYNSGKIATWVDWNEDGDFADANEYIGISGNSTSGNQVMSFSINVPSGASAGIKRLRVRSFLSDDIVSSSNYDTTYEYGETEDYNLVVNPTLEVAEAYTGASYANGSYQIVYNSSVTATAGTRVGYICTGWVGTGNIPASGVANTTNFTITQHSTITWQWTAVSCEKTWSGSTTDWATNNNWTPTGIPTASHCVKIPSVTFKPIIQVGTDALAKNLTVESGGQLNIKGNLTVTDFIENKGNETDLIVESDANLVQINTVTNLGNITLKRDSKMKRLDYIYWGSPVDGQNFINFSPNTVASRFYRYNEQFDSFHIISNLNDTMIAGEGYAIRAPNNQNATTPSTGREHSSANQITGLLPFRFLNMQIHRLIRTIQPRN